MLKLSRKCTDVKKAKVLIEWYLRQNILEFVRNEILDYEKAMEKKSRKMMHCGIFSVALSD